MFIRWVDGAPAGDPSNLPVDGDDSFVPCVMPGIRKSPSQTIRWDLIDGVAVGSWEGSEDPLDCLASLEELKRARVELMEAPIEIDGQWWQFDRVSRETMAMAIVALEADSELTLNWRLLNNATVAVNAAQLQAVYDQLVLALAQRGIQIDAEYVVMRDGSCTFRDIDDWRASYAPPVV